MNQFLFLLSFKKYNETENNQFKLNPKLFFY